MKLAFNFLLAVLLLTATGYAFAKPHPAGGVVNSADIVDRHLSGFTGVNVAGSFDVYITQGATESVKVQAPADVMSHIITEVSGGVLKIYNKHDTWHWGDWWGHHKKIVIFVVAKNLNNVNLSGSGDVYFKDGISSPSLKLSVVGSGDMTGRINVKNLESSVSGSGDMRLSGRAENSTVMLVGSGDFTARDLPTVYTAVHVAGSGDAWVNAGNKIDASVSGSGDVHYTGAAKVISSSKTGSGDITRF